MEKCSGCCIEDIAPVGGLIKLHGVKVDEVITFFDKVQVWLKQTLTREERAWLESQCAGILHVKNKRPKFDHSYVQRLQLNQPNDRALHYLAHRSNVLLNRVEWVLDWIFDDEQQKDAAWEFVCAYHVKSHHQGADSSAA